MFGPPQPEPWLNSGPEEDLPLLLEKLDDPSSWVKVAAARGVYRLGGREALVAMDRKDDPAAPYFRQVLAEEAEMMSDLFWGMVLFFNGLVILYFLFLNGFYLTTTFLAFRIHSGNTPFG